MTNFADVPLIDLATLARAGADAAHEMRVIERACACEGFFRFRDNAGVPAGLVQQNFELDRILWGSPPAQLAALFTDPSRDLSGRGIEMKGARTLDVRVAKGKNDISMSFGWTREFTAHEADELEIRCKDVLGIVPAWLDDFVPDSPSQATLPAGPSDNVMFAANVWYQLKKNWAIEAQRFVRARRGMPPS